jgi:hypothetical protein
MLKTIQEMNFFRQTAYGDSKDFAGLTVDIKTQGLCQGNGAAPAGWTVVSIVILNAHRRRGHGAKFLCPILLVRSNLAAVLFEDDTDVIHLDMTRQERPVEALHGLQESVYDWGKLLITTGESLKPSICFFHLISFSRKPDGTWIYDSNEEDEEMQLEIPLPDSSSEWIRHCGVNEVHKTLGTMTCLLGSHKAPIAHMKEKAQGWVDLAISAILPCQSLWFLVDWQFAPKVFFGIGLNSAPYAVLAGCLMKQYHALVPLGGVRWSADRMVQQLDRGFFGVGCPYPAIECLALQTTKMLKHYGCEMAVGCLLQPSVALLILELGMGSQPFTMDFLKCGAWVTDSWVKSL